MKARGWIWPFFLLVKRPFSIIYSVQVSGRNFTQKKCGGRIKSKFYKGEPKGYQRVNWPARTGILYYFNQFVSHCDAWRGWQKYGFVRWQRWTWQLQNFVRQSIFFLEISRWPFKFKLFFLLSKKDFVTSPKWPWPSWHFVDFWGPVTRDWRIEWNGTVVGE